MSFYVASDDTTCYDSGGVSAFLIMGPLTNCLCTQIMQIERGRGKMRWSIMGQSFAGDCCVIHLSIFHFKVDTILRKGGRSSVIQA